MVNIPVSIFPEDLKKAVLIQAITDKHPNMPVNHFELTPPETAMSEIPKEINPPTPPEILNSPPIIKTPSTLETLPIGRSIGQSRTMLQIIASMDRLKTLTLESDAI
jgi:hypothetical protein